MSRALLVFFIAVSTGCSSFPSEMFREAPWQGEIQGAVLGLECQDPPLLTPSLCERLVLVVADVVTGRSASGSANRRIEVDDPLLRRRLLAVPVGNHLEVHLHVPDGKLVMKDFEDHGAVPTAWQGAVVEAAKAYEVKP